MPCGSHARARMEKGNSTLRFLEGFHVVVVGVAEEMRQRFGGLAVEIFVGAKIYFDNVGGVLDNLFFPVYGFWFLLAHFLPGFSEPLGERHERPSRDIL